MSTHSQTQRRFLAAWDHMVGARGVPTIPRRRGRKPRVPVSQLLLALTYHVMQHTGTLADHLFQLFRERWRTVRGPIGACACRWKSLPI
jgi:hypothetical protein